MFIYYVLPKININLDSPRYVKTHVKNKNGGGRI